MYIDAPNRVKGQEGFCDLLSKIYDNNTPRSFPGVQVKKDRIFVEVGGPDHTKI
ncbi:MAG: hypothetical protein STSR0007_12020 [Thermovirga sp.]